MRQVRARDLYGEDDAHARPDRQRLDDVQGRRQPHLQPDLRRAGRPGGAPVQPVHRDHRGLLATTRPRCATWARSTSPSTCSRGRRRLGEAPRDGPHGGAAARPGDRHQLLPERAGGGVQPALASGRARADGPAGRLLRAAGCRSTPPEALELSTRISEEIYLTALEVSCALAAAARRPPGVRPDPRGRRRPAAGPVGRDADPDRALGGAARAGRRARPAQRRCWWRSRRPRRSPRSPAATSASSRRCPTCSSARRCRGSSSR